jgi:long-chain acyl-CoA synthetase
MVDVGGLKVYPREVEEVLFEHPAVREAAVIGIPDPYMGEVPKAFVVLKDPQHEIPKQELVDYCSQRLAKYKVPRTIEFVNDLPKTLVGKVLRRELKESEARTKS